MNELFFNYQPQLLKLANSQVGREFLGIKEKERIVKLTPNSYHTLKGDKFKGVFRTYPLYLKRLASSLSRLEILKYDKDYGNLEKYAGLLHYSGLLNSREFPLILADSLSVFSNAGGDGQVVASDGTWATVRGAATGTATSNGTAIYTMAYFDTGVYYIRRGFFPFLTSALTSSAVVSAATFSLFESPDVAIQNDDTNFIVILESTQAAGDALANDDYNNFNTTELATRLAFASVATDAYNNFALNAAGLAMVSKTGYTKFCVQQDSDFDNSAPSSGGNQIGWSSADEAGTGEDPKLVITYTLVAGTTGLQSKYW